MADGDSKRGWNFQDLTGQRFGRLVVKAYVRRAPGTSVWRCLCDCGTEKDIYSTCLKAGKTRSCGCLSREITGRRAREMNATHGASRRETAPAYKTWYKMMRRCYDPKDRCFADYGGRGITVCDRWHDVRNFVADMGNPPPGLSIDRIENDGPYSPENCRWADAHVQSNNRRGVTRITFNGVTDTVSGWAKRTGIPRTALKMRIYSGWSTEQALTRPVKTRATQD